MDRKIVDSLTEKIIVQQDENKCWNVLKEGDKYYPEFNYYCPNFKSTLWTLILLADIQCNIQNKNLIKPLKILSNHLFDIDDNIYSIGKSHFPIPCLNGNMLYLHFYFQFESAERTDRIIDFFAENQRFDDGETGPSPSFPYYRNKSCFGTHSCYWGIVKLLKGLSFIPQNKRSEKAQKLLEKCIDFILLHEVCFRSHNKSEYLHKNICKLTFPNMYQSDYLEILWLLKREKVHSAHMDKALMLLKEQMQPDSTWKIERQFKNMVIPLGNKNFGHDFITERAREVIRFYL